MSYAYGNRSQENLDTCHPDIQAILNEAIKIYDISVLEGYRSVERQNELFKQNKSKIDGITRKGKHNYYPSLAVDIMPYKRGTNAFSGEEKDNRRFYFMMGIIKSVSENLYSLGTITHKVRFGNDWDGDDIYTDQVFDDLPHFELVK
jgi:peptidoglycan L-alanyl-D-glutamate endopeptidase CwlK